MKDFIKLKQKEIHWFIRIISMLIITIGVYFESGIWTGVAIAMIGTAIEFIVMHLEKLEQRFKDFKTAARWRDLK